MKFSRKLDFSVKQVKMKFFRACNALLSNCSHAAELFNCHLVWSYCLPIVMYACDVIELMTAKSKMLNAAWNKVYTKIFSLDFTSVTVIMVFAGTLAFD